MGLLDLAQQEVPEIVVSPEGEHRVQIVNAESKMYSSGRTGYDVLLKSDFPNSKLIMFRVFNPKEGDSEDTKNAMIRSAKRFVEAFGVQSDEPTEWIGLETWTILSIETDPEYGDRNVVKRFVAHTA